ncbi:MAG: collagen-like triple helix repeat-containing protein [Nitrososphaeraceae archaeon]
MKKSLFSFALLASSLVMLSMMPFLNNNSFLSNPAMAQEYDTYGDSSYSKYPTDDNKYECRTGPLEGFFVSSVEFCNFNKFDKDDNDRQDNRTGTQGPAGPQGVPGPQGERGLTGATGMTGPAGTDGEDGATGITFLNGTNLYRVVADRTFAEEGDFSTFSFAECDSRDSPVNGFSIYSPGLIAGNGTISFTGTIANLTTGFNLTALPTGYLTSVIDATANDLVRSGVTCFDNPPLR